MSGSFAASLSRRRTPLALSLCLLAFLFAIEAKTARYGPAGGIGSSVRAAKAQPAPAPRVVNHGVPTPDPAHPHAPFLALPPMNLAIALSFPVQAPGAVLVSHLSQFPAAGFSFSNLFRPPPAS
jgi:hypothetical protein